METARNSVVVKRPLDEVHQQWQSWVGERLQGTTEGGQASETVPSAQMPVDEAEKGKIYFNEAGDDSTKVTMELRFNRDALREADRTPEWVGQRVELFLDRFREFAEK